MKKSLIIALASLALAGCSTTTVQPTTTDTPTSAVPTPDATTTTTPVIQTPTATPRPKQAAGQTALDLVASHNTLSDCRSVINGKSYDLTSYAPKHPGGPAQIEAICGKDGSSLFGGQHGGNGKIEAMMASFEVK